MAMGLVTKSYQKHVCFVAPLIYPVLADISSSSIVGGSEVQQSIIIRGLRLKGFRISVITEDFGQPDDFEIDGVRIIKLIRRGPQIRFIRAIHPNMTSIWQAMKKADADIYFQRCAGMTTAVACLFSRWHRKKFIFSSACDLDYELDKTSQLFNGLGGWMYFQLYKIALRQTDVAIAQHPRQAAAFKKWYGREAIVVPNCYQLESSSSGDASLSKVILWVSTLHKVKRPELFLELARRLPQYQFRMVGGESSDPDSKYVYSLIEQDAKNLENLEFVGFVPYSKVGMQFDEACLFVNTSDYEGFPNTFLQAWARGVPTVSFIDCGAYKDEKPIGNVVQDISEMVGVIQEKLTDKVLWIQESRAVKHYFYKNHSVETAIDLYQRILSDLGMKGQNRHVT